ncbi:unnamed protein product [Cercospora beticola]|nr:unnamed protein product [Cercospora beticola]
MRKCTRESKTCQTHSTCIRIDLVSGKRYPQNEVSSLGIQDISHDQMPKEDCVSRKARHHCMATRTNSPRRARTNVPPRRPRQTRAVAKSSSLTHTLSIARHTTKQQGEQEKFRT